MKREEAGPSLVIETPIGPLRLTEDGGALCAVRLIPGAKPGGEGTPLLWEAARQLDAYFAGALRAFDLPISPRGTPFELRVWQALRAIPYGQTRAYGGIAAAIGRPTACRAVGGACGRNPLLIVTPCHRVVGAGGKLTGFAAGLCAKRALLSLESGVGA